MGESGGAEKVNLDDARVIVKCIARLRDIPERSARRRLTRLQRYARNVGRWALFLKLTYAEVCKRSYTPGGAGYERARSEFQQLSGSQLKSGGVSFTV